MIITRITISNVKLNEYTKQILTLVPELQYTKIQEINSQKGIPHLVVVDPELELSESKGNKLKKKLKGLLNSDCVQFETKDYI